MNQRNHPSFIYKRSLEKYARTPSNILITKEVVEERTVSVTTSNKVEAESEALRMVRKNIENEKDYDTVIKLSIADGKDRP